ncbi:MAG: epoxide hydrolase family protein [Myxococcota bacterium]
MEKFEVSVPDAVLEDLQLRLANPRFPDQLEGAGWDYGTELEYLRELVDYWRYEFDWRAQEKILNRFAQYKTRIDDLEIHFVHAKSGEPSALPLVITHGWPGSVFEFYKIIGPLTDPAAHGGRAEDAFHVVCPSMPGYGFSSAPTKPGFDVRAVAETIAKLMAALGYEAYGAQGGDWGAIASTWLGVIDAEHVRGIHLNMVIAGRPTDVEDPTAGLDPEELADLSGGAEFAREETGYQRIQGTRPQTLGYGLNDSPVGLAAWIVEKFRAWSDCNGNPENRFTKDELLTNIMIYWVTQSITSSTRLYYETLHADRFGAADERVEVPTGVALFPKEMSKPPRAWAERRYNIRRWTRLESGGHFAALEEPEALVGEIRDFFRELR